VGRIQLFSSRLSRLPDDPLAFAPSASVVVPAYFLESFSASIGTKLIASDRVLLIHKVLTLPELYWHAVFASYYWKLLHERRNCYEDQGGRDVQRSHVPNVTERPVQHQPG
jgi:hypothetical protein